VKIDDYGRVELTETEAIQALLTGRIQDLTNVYISDADVRNRFNQAILENADDFAQLDSKVDLDISIEDFDRCNQKNWFMPEDYYPDLLEYLYGCCTTTEQMNRVSQELELFSQHGMIDLLHYIKYLVDTMREHNILWGVGRGSSVASYVLYLLGAHKIDSIKYNLDISEFLR
jgi:DNA polymerase III alpha subunit